VETAETLQVRVLPGVLLIGVFKEKKKKMDDDKLCWKTTDRDGYMGAFYETGDTGKLYIKCYSSLTLATAFANYMEVDLSIREEESLLRALQKRHDKRQ